MKIKILAFLLLISLMAIPVHAATNTTSKMLIDIMVNGHYIKSDTRPFLSTDTTYVPIRFVSEALGADEVSWDANNRAAIVKDNGTEIVLPIGKHYALVNGQYMKLTHGIQLINDRTFVPVRFIAENLGATVTWNNQYFIVNINKPSIEVPTS
ncbi:MAG: copper amine oxidase N-terminal domain-containing protein, partial [Hyphomonadaceae bacterium]|nr:copper amine oxidase N-terminal domain-containing protein [Clostridia bacterium]